MHKFDGIFDGEDVIRVDIVDAIEHSCQRRRFARSGGPGDQHDASTKIHDLPELRRKMQIVKAGNYLSDYAHHNGVAAALLTQVHSKSAVSGEPGGKIAGAVRAQRFFRLLVVANHFIGNTVRVWGWERCCSGDFYGHTFAGKFD